MVLGRFRAPAHSSGGQVLPRVVQLRENVLKVRAAHMRKAQPHTQF